jgi:hypothetical protein
MVRQMRPRHRGPCGRLYMFRGFVFRAVARGDRDSRTRSSTAIPCGTGHRPRVDRFREMHHLESMSFVHGRRRGCPDTASEADADDDVRDPPCIRRSSAGGAWRNRSTRMPVKPVTPAQEHRSQGQRRFRKPQGPHRRHSVLGLPRRTEPSFRSRWSDVRRSG